MAKNAANDTTLQSTKQMLDELDALMEQMLSLPVNDLDEAPSFPKEVVKPHALTASLTLLESPAPLNEARLPAPIAHPPLNAPHLTMPVYLQPLTNDALPASLLAQMEPLLSQIPESDAAATTLWIYLPLVWINQAFDGCTMVFGGLGALLRTGASRMLLGLSGMAMLAVSAAWFAKDWLGWNW
jgi:hypothetical protein